MGSIATESDSLGLTKEFLEETLKLKVISFKVKPGTNPGDNFTSVLHSIEVIIKNNDNDKKHQLDLILKSYPSHPGRQKFLDDTNLFWKESMIYKVLIPELNKFGREQVLNYDAELKLTLPTFIDGKANFVDKETSNNANLTKNQFDFLDNYILMIDARQDLGFKMAGRSEGLDYEHCKLVITGLAKLHAVNWAYKIKNGLTSLQQKFPFVKEVILVPDQAPALSPVLSQNFETLKVCLESSLGNDSEDFQAFLKLEENMFERLLLFLKNDEDIDEEMIGELFRLKPNTLGGKPSWKVGSHGDLWVNNFLFRYNEAGNPIEAMFVDLQLYREACPTIDLSYFIYTSTNSALRAKYLDTLLQLYFETFFKVCKALKVQPFPGFSFPELQRRFHVSKLFGLISAILLLPVVLTKPEEAIDLDKTQSSGKEADQLSDLLKEIGKSSSNNQFLTERISEIVHEMRRDGVI